MKDLIAAYKYPRIVRFGPIPKGPTGKILKRRDQVRAVSTPRLH